MSAFSRSDHGATSKATCEQQPDLKRHLNVISGKFAWSKKIEEEVALDTLEADRGAREASAYVPTFFTSQTNIEALHAARPERKAVAPAAGLQQRTFNTPLYYRRQ